ncbi:MAG: TolC family protein [Acidobacteriota bacterium]
MSRRNETLTPVVAIVAALAIATTTGCITVGPDYVEPEIETPDAWHTAATTGIGDGTATLQTWWNEFDDPILSDLIHRSTEGNLSLREALWRVEEARALRGIAGSPGSPQVNATGQSSRSEASDNGLGADLAPPGGFEAQSLHDYGVGASWEIDLFGRIRRQAEAADATTQGSVEAYRDVMVSLYAEVALAYVSVRSSQERIGLAKANVQGQEETLQLTGDRFAVGLVSALDVAQAESNVANTRSLIPVLETRLSQSLNRLAVLLGESPGALHDELATPAPIPHEPPAVIVSLPAELLRQRPDVRLAERGLAAQTARIGVATADLYPSFSLGGFLGLQSTSGGDFFDSGSLTWNVGLPIRWNIFSGGRIRNQIRAEEARTEQMLAAYEQTVLSALEESENSMVAYANEVKRRSHLRDSVEATEHSLELVLTQYRSGLTNFQNVLDTQRSLLTRQDELAASEGDAVSNLIRLYRALGGGWDPETPIEVPATDQS